MEICCVSGRLQGNRGVKASDDRPSLANEPQGKAAKTNLGCHVLSLLFTVRDETTN